MLGQTLRRLREERNLTQTELADLLGVAPSFISLLERGERQPSVETLARLAGIFGVSYDDLLGAPIVPTAKAAP